MMARPGSWRVAIGIVLLQRRIWITMIAMRAMWSGNITFGLVHIPVKLYAATEDRDIRFHQVHVADGGRIKYQRVCQTCDQVVPFAEIGKGFEDEAGRRVIISEEELDNLRVPHGRDVEIVEFAPTSQIDPIHFDKAYYLEPSTGAAKPYVLLRQALQQTERTAVVTMTLRTRTRLALLRVRDDALVLQTMLWPDEVRAPEFSGISDDDVSVRPQELAMAGSLVESLSGDFEPSKYRDEYREAVQALLEQRLAGEDVILPPDEDAIDESGTVIDLMAALQESVRRTQAARAAAGEGAGEDGGSGERATGTGRTPARKSPAKRTSSGDSNPTAAAAKKATPKPAKRAAG
jgi:DNA end-binding protein Ku